MTNDDQTFTETEVHMVLLSRLSARCQRTIYPWKTSWWSSGKVRSGDVIRTLFNFSVWIALMRFINGIVDSVLMNCSRCESVVQTKKKTPFQPVYIMWICISMERSEAVWKTASDPLATIRNMTDSLAMKKMFLSMYHIHNFQAIQQSQHHFKRLHL